MIPFEVQIAIDDKMVSEEDLQVVSDTLYQGGSLLTDTITDWMNASFLTKTSIDQAEALLVNNITTFDSIALELEDDETSIGMIDGEEMTLVQVSYFGFSLWERIGTGTPPMEAELVELIQRATFLEDRSLKAALQITVNNLLFALGIESVNGVELITIAEVRAYITPNGSIGSSGDDNDQDGGKENDQDGGEENEDSTNDNNANDVNTTNKNLETIIIVAIVVACLAFALLIFAVVWAWRSDRKDRDRKPSSSSSASASRKPTKKDKKNKKSKAEQQRATEPSMNGNGVGVGAGAGRTQTYGQRQSTKKEMEAEIEPASSYDLPRNNSDGSYPRVIGKNGNYNNGGADDSAVGFDSVVSEDVSSIPSAYYKSSNIHNNSHSESRRAGSGGRNFNDAASMSSMDSYGYSLDGYAPSLGPAQGGYPVGPMAAARDAPMPMGDAMDSNADTTDDDDATTDEYGFDDVANNDLRKLQDEESVADYDAEVANA